jgi:glycosyltransferase involved in cell wall biosynthesis
MKISIITVTFNSADYIENCLNSISNQLYDNVEHIVIDGKSTDNTLNFLNSKRRQLATLLSEKDCGIYDAMNKGINLANGDVIGFLNSDDFYASNKILSKVANIFKDNPSIDACYADLTYIDRVNENIIIRYWKSNQFVPGSFSKGWCPPHPTFFVRSSVYKKFGKFNINYQIAADVELMMRLIEIKKINVLYIPEIWVKMRMGGLSNKSLKNIIKLNKEIFYALKSYNLPRNPFIFFTYKMISRFKQFLIAKRFFDY